MIPGYEDTLNIPVDVVIQPGLQRPTLEPHPDHDHPLVRDFHQGITLEEAEARIQKMMEDYS